MVSRKLFVGGAAATVIAVIGGSYFLQQKSGSSDFCIGVVMPQTGDTAYIGESMRKGMDLARAEYETKTGNKPFKLRVEFADNAGNPAKAVTGYQSLANVKGCKTVIAVQQGVKALIPLADKDKQVLLATSVPDNGIAGQSPWAFRFFTSAKTDAQVMMDYAVKKLNVRKVAILYVDDSSGASYRDSVKETLTALGGQVVATEAFNPGAGDYRNQILKIKQSNPDAVYLMGYGKSMANIPIQMREAGVTAKLLSVGTLSQPEILKAAGKAAEGAYYTTAEFFTFDPKTPELKKFVGDYKAKFGQVPVFFEVFGYDSLKLLIRSAEQAGTDPEKLRAALANTQSQALAVGSVSVGKDGDVKFPVVVRKIVNGQWTNVQ